MKQEVPPLNEIVRPNESQGLGFYDLTNTLLIMRVRVRPIIMIGEDVLLLSCSLVLLFAAKSKLCLLKTTEQTTRRP